MRDFERWAPHFLRTLLDNLRIAGYGGTIVREYRVSYIIRDGEHSRDCPSMLGRYADPAAAEIAEQVMEDGYEDPGPFELSPGAVASVAVNGTMRAVVVFQYDSLSAGTRVTFRI